MFAMLENTVRLPAALASCLAVILFGSAHPASSETREAYLARLQYICEVECLQPRELLRTARKRRASVQGDLAGIIDIGYVSERDGKFLLHEHEPNPLDMSELDFGMPQLEQSQMVNANRIVIELDEQTARDLLGEPATAVASARKGGGDSGIVVEGDRQRKLAKPSLEAIEDLFRQRRIVVRGTPRLDVGFVGARRDRRQKMLTILPASADDVVILRRYDADGNPVLDGRLAGLRVP